MIGTFGINRIEFERINVLGLEQREHIRMAVLEYEAAEQSGDQQWIKSAMDNHKLLMSEENRT